MSKAENFMTNILKLFDTAKTISYHYIFSLIFLSKTEKTLKAKCYHRLFFQSLQIFLHFEVKSNELQKIILALN